ncbi:MAG: hypothetical protein LBS06_02710, partial [Treponema sp.]|nr:hypothetical protein [Treponema sp.]
MSCAPHISLRMFLPILLCCTGMADLNAQTSAEWTLNFGSSEIKDRADIQTVYGSRLFPSAYFSDFVNTLRAIDHAKPYWAPDEKESLGAGGFYEESMLLNNDILAFYGHPLSKNMGILGRYTVEELDARLSALAAEYAEVNGGRGVRRAFYLIYGTVWP